jgi:hypothetical protein
MMLSYLFLALGIQTISSIDTIYRDSMNTFTSNNLIVSESNINLESVPFECFEGSGDMAGKLMDTLQMDSLTTYNWKERNRVFEKTIISIIQKRNKNSKSIRKCFKCIEEDYGKRIAYIPIAFIFGKYNKQEGAFPICGHFF